jgi:phosphoserine phosphatase RsbU/P
MVAKGDSSLTAKKPLLLIVEDSLAERELIKLKLRKFGYNTVEVQDGEQAFSYLQENQGLSSQVDMVLSDWHMPNMDGLTLCKKVKSEIAQAPYFMILTSRTNPVDLVAAMDSGADDYLSKPFNSEELRVRILAGLRVITLMAETQHKNIELRAALAKQTELNNEIAAGQAAAAQLQASTLPDDHVNMQGIAMAHYFKAAQGVAGDMYALLSIADEKLVFYQIDVAGSGVRSAMLSYAIARYIKELTGCSEVAGKALNISNPAEVVSHLNIQFACAEHNNDAFTLLYGVIDLANNTITFCQAGHPHPFLIHSNGKIKRLGRGGTAVGISRATCFANEQCSFNQGDRLAVFSDGVWECKLAAGRQVTELILAKLLKRLTRLSLRKLQHQLQLTMDKIVGDEAPRDDISFLVLGHSDE